MTEILIILVLILANGVFAGAEIAVLSLRKTRIQALVDEERAGARSLVALREAPERVLATVQIGISLVGASAAAFGGQLLADDVASVVGPLFALEADTAANVGLAIVVTLVSFASIVLGELVPKSLALHVSERYALLIARPMRLIAQIFRPIVWLLTSVSNVLLRPFGDRTNFSEARFSPDEIRQLVHEAAQAGSLDTQAGELASRAIDLADLPASAVMVPRNRIIGLDVTSSRAEILAVVRRAFHTTLPVYEGSLDNVVGMLHTRDVLLAAVDGAEIDLRALVRPVLFVPETQLAGHVLRHLQARRTRVAMVVDEFGGVAGLVTIEDVVEEIVGDIVGSGGEAEAGLREVDGTFLVRGDTALRELDRVLGIDLDEETEYSTVAGLCIDLHGGIPTKGTVIEGPGGTRFEIVDATPQAVRQVKVRPPAA